MADPFVPFATRQLSRYAGRHGLLGQTAAAAIAHLAATPATPDGQVETAGGRVDRAWLTNLFALPGVDRAAVIVAAPPAPPAYVFRLSSVTRLVAEAGRLAPAFGDGSNPEYDRALVDLIVAGAGVAPGEYREVVTAMVVAASYAHHRPGV